MTTETPTIAVYVMDRSGSMVSYAPTPKTALNQALLTLKESPVAERIAAMIVSFAGDCAFDVPLQPVRRVQPLETYNPDGGTALYDALLVVMRPLIAGHRACVSLGREVNVIFTIFTDGEDNQSSPNSLNELRLLAGQARVLGWQLYTNGFGVDAARVASRMGFPSDADHATSHYAARPQEQAANIAHSVCKSTTRTLVTATGCLQQPDTSPPSTPH